MVKWILPNARRGARRFDEPLAYTRNSNLSVYAKTMRTWPGFEAPEALRDHVIRYLPRDQAEGLDLPGYDFWLMDSARVGILRFSDDDALLGAEIDDDPVLVARHCYYRDVAWQNAIPYAEYAGS